MRVYAISALIALALLAQIGVRADGTVCHCQGEDVVYQVVTVKPPSLWPRLVPVLLVALVCALAVSELCDAV